MLEPYIETIKKYNFTLEDVLNKMGLTKEDNNLNFFHVKNAFKKLNQFGGDDHAVKVANFLLDSEKSINTAKIILALDFPLG